MRHLVKRAAAVVLASGAGTRVGAGVNKVFLPLAGRRVVSWSLEAFARVEAIGPLLLVARPEDGDLVRWVLDREVNGPVVEVVHGGRTRQESELRALRHLAERIDRGAVDMVLIHDGARPLVSPALIAGVLHEAREHGGAIPGLPARDIVAVAPDGAALGARPSASLVLAQTPQAFRAAPLLEAYEAAAREGFDGTDTSSVMERFSSVPVRWIRGEQENLKVTYPRDLVVAEHVLASVDYRR
ncbi:2-C-methyl-D-erythritol 4-phosphate cytidylyltransferase [Amycolatopsis alkalitolerans]|uniref:2-C-methyl-D-erythritol 4-phosphate cytidylyltransferase n=1 Tax=Amycolatopsis alkalitolerans TaxID=2547244 RepID=A0A5C4M7Q1_9PSEU|nr:2-C-methyl-D-erythritol 4-phosphate cytidylyltransferase [Amycolatopsis alkalitolerans]TNC29477.1 2-C-methyl-D-erythritol 4-phosphate cytidylyltransferase [Amycolatopsis alkalitolerans]